LVKLFVKGLLKSVNELSNITYLDAVIVMRKINNLFFKIPTEPTHLDTVSRHEKENFTLDVRVDFMEFYFLNKLHKDFGIDYNTYKKLTREELEYMKHYIEYENKVKSLNSNLYNDLQEKLKL